MIGPCSSSEESRTGAFWTGFLPWVLSAYGFAADDLLPLLGDCWSSSATFTFLVLSIAFYSSLFAPVAIFALVAAGFGPFFAGAALNGPSRCAPGLCADPLPLILGVF